MGGNAIKSSERINRSERDKIVNSLYNRLSDSLYFNHVDYMFITEYSEKESFGDIDVLFHKSLNREEVVNSMGIGQVVCRFDNGDVISIGLYFYGKIVQVDLIFVDNLALAHSYFSYNDLGNLLGRLAHSVGFKYGHDGLWYHFRSGTEVFYKHLVSDDIFYIKVFLGVDPMRWERGFNNLEEIFHYVSTSDLFNRDIFLLENRNNKGRTRDSKRKTYMEFLSWLEGLPYSEYWYGDNEVDKGVGLARADTLFDFKAVRDEVYLKRVEDLSFRCAWNGKLVSEWTGLEGRELGEFMKYLNSSYDTKSLYKNNLNMKGFTTGVYSVYKSRRYCYGD